MVQFSKMKTQSECPFWLSTARYSTLSFSVLENDKSSLSERLSYLKLWSTDNVPFFILHSNQKTIRTFFESKKPVSLVCHAPAVLTGVKLTDGSWIVKGRKVAGFSNAEEEQAGMTKNVPYLLETVVKEQGGLYEGELSGLRLFLLSRIELRY